jgi:hypothetical protein
VEDHSGSGPRRRTLTLVAGIALAALAGTAGIVVFWPSAAPDAAAQPAPTPSRPQTPFELSAAQLDAQAAALLAGDEKGWLAPVDASRPKLVQRYRAMYRNLRGLGVSHAEYHARPVAEELGLGNKEGRVTATALLGYCFSGVSCPTWRNSTDDGAPKVTHRVTFELRAGKYLITGLTRPPGAADNHLEPAPWDGDELVFARGERVTVAAARSEGKHARKVLAAAEKAAVMADRFAGYMANKQQHYRIYLADDKGWKTWYGGQTKSWWIGYALPLNTVGSDVVLRTGKVMSDRRQLALTVQHELGHVVTLAGITHRETADDQWLTEGIAEYIGAYPRRIDDTGNRRFLAAEFQRKDAPRTIATASLTDDADDRSVNRLYAMGHLAAACMADKYGERRLFTFVDRVLRQGDKPDQASHAAYGKPFATVDHSCLKWIKARTA